MKIELDLLPEDLKEIERLELLRYAKNIVNGIDIDKLTRREKRHILKNDNYSDSVKKILNKK